MANLLPCLNRNPAYPIIISLCLLFTSGFCQTTTSPDPFDASTATDFLPPSPNSASLGRYGGANIGIASGTMQKQIELLSFGSSKLKIPISLNYASNGIKVDEVGSRTGMSWNLQAGGVITRTVMGEIDEYSQRAVPPVDLNVQDRAFVNFMESMVSVNGFPSSADGEPDVFTFNFAGYNGKFILDEDFNPVLLTHSGLKIVRVDFDNFTIITPDGIKYNFGGTNAVETLSKSQAVAGCGKIFQQPASTAFYLREIIHPNGEVISLRYSTILYSYKAGMSSNLSKYIVGTYSECTLESVGGYSNTNCVTAYTTDSPVLEEISSSVYGKVLFQYSSRLDLGDKLLVGIQAFKPNQSTPYKSYTLGYLQQQATTFLSRSSLISDDQRLLYRPFLISVIEKDSSSVIGRKYQLSYNKLNTLPPRLSYAQDHYGYFNGKVNNTFYSKPESVEWQLAIPEATANREPDENYVSAGMLSKITYPTGGSDSIVYESNTEWREIKVPGPTMYFALTATGSAPQKAGIVTSEPIPIGGSQPIAVSVRCEVNPEAGGPYPGSGTADIYEDNVLISTIAVQVGASVTQVVYFSAGKTYKVKVTASRGEWISCTVNFSYQSGSVITTYANNIAAGVRVSKIITDGGNGPAQQKKYTYEGLKWAGRSTGVGMFKPVYERIDEVFGRCAYIETSGPEVHCEVGKAAYYTFSSSSVINGYRFSGAPVYYSAVLEEDLSNNGGTEFQFSLFSDLIGWDILGKLPNPPSTINSDLNGLEVNRLIFKRSGSTVVPVKEIYTHYKVDSRINNQLSAYVVRKKYNYPCIGDIPSPNELRAYDFLRYDHNQRWVYVDTARTRVYDGSGTSFNETLQISFYDNATHAQLSRTKVIKSDGSQEITQSLYPDDYAAGTAFIDNMKSNSAHLSGFPIEQVRYKETGGSRTILSGTITKYLAAGQGRIDKVMELESAIPISSASFKFSNSAQGTLPNGNAGASPFVSDAAYMTRLTYNNYDNKGNLLSMAKEKGPKTSYIWGYGKQYPIAETSNGDLSEVYQQNFEEPELGLDFEANVVTDPAKSHTGKYSGRLINTGTSELSSHSSRGLNISLTAAKKFIYSGWVYSTGPSAEILLFMMKAGETAYFSYVDAVSTTQINKWVYIKKEFLVPADVVYLKLRLDNNSTGTVWFDDLRIRPSDADMSTYTYEPLVGMTSAVDNKGQTLYYEYDPFQRLKYIRNQDRDIIKSYDYNYKP